MDHLYTPWRMAYIRGEKKPQSGCVFCSAQNASDEDALIVARSETVFVILNLFPYNPGHLMVIPYEHIETQEGLSDAALLDMMRMTNRAIATLRELYQPHGFNLGSNTGSAAGAGIAEHTHFHVVPRWNGDASFMTPISDTRVIPDLLDNTHRELKAVWQKLFGETHKHER